MSLPVGDPQFWLATLVVAICAGWVIRRVRRSLRESSEAPCANCPKVPDGSGPRLVAAGKSRRESGGHR